MPKISLFNGEYGLESVLDPLDVQALEWNQKYHNIIPHLAFLALDPSFQ